jgi:hypothetical protein
MRQQHRPQSGFPPFLLRFLLPLPRVRLSQRAPHPAPPLSPARAWASTGGENDVLYPTVPAPPPAPPARRRPRRCPCLVPVPAPVPVLVLVFVLAHSGKAGVAPGGARKRRDGGRERGGERTPACAGGWTCAARGQGRRPCRSSARARRGGRRSGLRRCVSMWYEREEERGSEGEG